MRGAWRGVPRAHAVHYASCRPSDPGTTTLYHSAEQRLARLIEAGQADLLHRSQVGLEKESLRVASTGGIAQTPHPRALGSALTNPYITTDYSEALLEFITPPCADPREALRFLQDLHKFVYDHLDHEVLWSTSMPCVLAGEANIPIAQYGSSNVGMMKTVYRRGLGYRYGRMMQVIAGVHFNYSLADDFWHAYHAVEGATGSLQDFINDAYMGMIRNLQRFGWLVPYLFGVSPAVCKSFLEGLRTQLPEFDANTFYDPYATSLRMGDIGYQNNREGEIGIKACYDSLDSYIESLTCAIETPSPEYERIGVRVGNEYRQLNANMLQIENEYYSTVRPKQVLDDNEKPTLALKRRGIRYVELRSLDVNAFDPLGISEEQLYFLEALLVFSVLQDSPRISRDEAAAIDRNQNQAAHRGRDPRLELERGGERVRLRDWGLELLDAMSGVCRVLDGGSPDRPYTASLNRQRAALEDPSLTPSARMLVQMREAREGFYHFAMRMSRKHQRYFAAMALDPEREAFLADVAQRSLARQRQIEATDRLSFDEYLERYLAQRLDEPLPAL